MFTLSFRAKRGTSQSSFSTQITMRVASSSAPPLPIQVRPKLDCESLVVCPTRDDRLQCAAKVLEAVQTFFNYVQASGVTQPDRAVVTKRSSRNNGDARFTQQTVGEIL